MHRAALVQRPLIQGPSTRAQEEAGVAESGLVRQSGALFLRRVQLHRRHAVDARVRRQQRTQDCVQNLLFLRFCPPNARVVLPNPWGQTWHPPHVTHHNCVHVRGLAKAVFSGRFSPPRVPCVQRRSQPVCLPFFSVKHARTHARARWHEAEIMLRASYTADSSDPTVCTFAPVSCSVDVFLFFFFFLLFTC